ncbi:hypothetical protein QMK19_03480 [Streptomyces sp. H10-C2]|uniref:hypothetical protein n=1 Tax=unclassified Streptomyces TaxID=2593676 RepID=UPI0024BA6F13|nr:MULTISPECIES: hypothetical protein [unclassified Streptomyces]MDJ0342248.1 hypothetical protein [Streptomyces sp. PH10-H1]MDJ0368762.1 hypothetical protein [Streptomyces sp. H10-C2]
MKTELDTRMYDAIESALWQDVADALNRLEEYGLNPITALCDQFGAKPVATLDTGGVIHGGGRREDGEGYLLRYVPAFTPGPHGEDLPFGWTVAPRGEAS